MLKIFENITKTGNIKLYQEGRKIMNSIDNVYEYRYEREKAKVIRACGYCGYKIFEGEFFYNITNKIICDECILEFLKQYREMR